jgi:hypothetical protein
MNFQKSDTIDFSLFFLQVWLKAGVHPDDLELWIENLRKASA